MQTSTPQNKVARPSTAGTPTEELANELKFISELGRSLLLTIHPKKSARRVATAIQQKVDASLCAFVAELENIGVISCAFGPKGEIDDVIDRVRFEKWLAFMPPQVGYCEDDKSEFLLKGKHSCEYVSPLHINGTIRGAIIVAFEHKIFAEASARLIEAATQMAAMSVNLSANYETALNNSIHEARESNRKFTEAVLDALPVSLYVVDRDYRIVTWNKHREIGQLGIPRDEAIGRDVFEVLEKYPQGRVREEFERAFRTGEIERIEQRTIADDGSTKYWLVSKVPMKDPVSGEVTHVITVGEDVTVRVEAIQAMNRAEKLAAVGRLAAGVVHEINNPLATIAACAEALEQLAADGSLEKPAAKEDLTEYLGLIRSEVFRCKTITNDLLNFSRMGGGDKVPVDVGEIVQSAANLIAHQKRGDKISLQIEIEDALPNVLADGGQIQQAIIALATNAIDAMPNGGKLTFKAFLKGTRVVIEVADTGVGIPQENMSKIFEPFFTTKEIGKGTGLGLSVCYGIISEHGGRISVRSSIGQGTTFSISLPASLPTAE